MDTIFALASGRGRAGIAVIRLSGPASHKAVAALCGDVPPARYASVRVLRWQGEVLDEALVLTFPNSASFTGEESAELHVHGSIAVVDAVFAALRSFADLRLAEPGEFTRRALESGKMELFEVEGLIDLIDAETEAQRKQAQRMLQGDLGRQVAVWRKDLLQATALIEATIDFADEDVPVDVWPDVNETLERLITGLRTELSGAHMAERIRAGFEVAIYGPPNVGKSSLINALVKREVAITSPVAGTTRDIIEVRIDLDGLPVVLLDTAGLRETDDLLEKEGVRRARERLATADLKIAVIDDQHMGWEPDPKADLTISSKADLGVNIAGMLSVSAVTGVGLNLLRDELVLRLNALASSAGVVVNARHKQGVAAALESVTLAMGASEAGEDAEIVAARLRGARSSLESLTGKIGVEDVLGEIFGRFCIGK
jgi:tRNA modification GTPase